MANDQGNPESQEAQPTPISPQVDRIIANDSVPAGITLPSAQVPAEPSSQPTTPTNEAPNQPAPPPPANESE